MSDFDGTSESSEVSETSESSVDTTGETGGESSAETQEEVDTEGNESGFDESESEPETMEEDENEGETNEEVGFDEETDSTSELDDEDYSDEDSLTSDEDEVGFDETDNTDEELEDDVEDEPLEDDVDDTDDDLDNSDEELEDDVEDEPLDDDVDDTDDDLDNSDEELEDDVEDEPLEDDVDDTDDDLDNSDEELEDDVEDEPLDDDVDDTDDDLDNSDEELEDDVEDEPLEDDVDDTDDDLDNSDEELEDDVEDEPLEDDVDDTDDDLDNSDEELEEDTEEDENLEDDVEDEDLDNEDTENFENSDADGDGKIDGETEDEENTDDTETNPDEDADDDTDDVDDDNNENPENRENSDADGDGKIDGETEDEENTDDTETNPDEDTDDDTDDVDDENNENPENRENSDADGDGKTDGETEDEENTDDTEANPDEDADDDTDDVDDDNNENPENRENSDADGDGKTDGETDNENSDENSENDDKENDDEESEEDAERIKRDAENAEQNQQGRETEQKNLETQLDDVQDEADKKVESNAEEQPDETDKTEDKRDSFEDWINPDSYKDGKYTGNYRPNNMSVEEYNKQQADKAKAAYADYLDRQHMPQTEKNDAYSEYVDKLGENSEGGQGDVSESKNSEKSYNEYNELSANNQLEHIEKETPEVKTVNANDIYGVDSSGEHFWEHHENTKEDYMQIAEKLPEVQAKLDSGMTIEEIKQDPELADCVNAYYDPDKMVIVEQYGDAYIFQDDGRHRVAAAQELGYDVPVNVTYEAKDINATGEAKVEPTVSSDGEKNLPSDGNETPPDGPPHNDSPDGVDSPNGVDSPKEGFLTNDGKLVTYQDAVNEMTGKAEEYMKKMGVPEDKINEIKADMEKELYKQEYEARTRGIGDHGIRHIYGNFQRGESYLSSRDDVSDEQKLGVIVAQTYHDEGYTLKNDKVDNSGTLHGGTDKKHDEASLEVWNDKKDLYGEVFSKETMESIDKAIGEHNIGAKDKEHYGDVIDGKEKIKENTSKDSDVVVSTVHVADKLALSDREKFSDVLLKEPKLVELTEGMNSTLKSMSNEKLGFYDSNGNMTEQGKNLLEKYHNQINDYIDSKYGEPDASRMKEAVDKDIGFNSGKFSSRMNYIYTPSDCYKYNPETKCNEITVCKVDYGDTKSQDLQNQQLKKMFEDLGLDKDTVDKNGKTEVDRAIEQASGGEGYIDKERGLVVKIETKTAEEIRNLEAEKFQENNDKIEVNERIEAGRLEYQELNDKFMEVTEILDGEDITFDDYDKVCRTCNKADGCSKEEFESKTDSEKKELLNEAMSEMVLAKVNNTLWKEEYK